MAPSGRQCAIRSARAPEGRPKTTQRLTRNFRRPFHGLETAFHVVPEFRSRYTPG